MRDRRRVVLIGAVALAVVALVAVLLWPGPASAPEVGLTTFSQRLAAGDVATVTMRDHDHALDGRFTDGREFRVTFPSASTDEITRQITRARVAHFTVDQQQEAPWLSFLLGIAPFVFIGALVMVLLRTARGGRGLLEFGRKSRPVKRPPARRTCRSSRCRVPTSSRCSWVLARRASASSSSRPTRPRLRSSSSTSST